MIPGAIYGEGYRQLQSQCFAYIHATEVGGTHPALIEAMGCGAMVLYLTTPENEEAAGDAAIPFTAANICEQLQWAAGVAESERRNWDVLRAPRGRAL